MDLVVGEQFRKQYQIMDLEVTGWTTPTAAWAFRFYNGDTATVDATDVSPHPSSAQITIATFDIPSSLLTAARAGPFTYQISVKDDNDSNPTIYHTKREGMLSNPLDAG